MTATTPGYAWPYPEPSDARGAGANAIRDLALAIEDTLEADAAARAVIRRAAHSGASQTPLANGGWVNVAYAGTDDGNMSYDGVNMSYSGPARMFLITYTANVAVNGTQPNGGLRLLLSGSVADTHMHSDNYNNLAGACPVRLGAGTGFEVVTVQAYANDGSGAAGGAYDNASLRVTTLG
jgi:hypothetical protein